MMPAEQDRLPKLENRRWGWVVVLAFLVAGVVMGLLAPSLPTRVAGAAFLLGMAASMAWFLVKGGVWLTGTVLSVRRYGTRSVDLATADDVRLEATGIGIANLFARQGGRRVRMQVFAMTDVTKRSLPPQALERLAVALERNPLPAAADAAAKLHAQAAHLAAGGSLETAPLVPLTRSGLMKAAKGSTLGDLLDH